MTSSAKLLKRNVDFGPWYDHYVRPVGKCHPSFNTILLSDDARGAKVCTRKPEMSNDSSEPTYNYDDQYLFRYSRQLYDLNQMPIVRFNTQLPRITPDEYYNILHDYYKLEPQFNGTGLYKTKTCFNINEYALCG